MVGRIIDANRTIAGNLSSTGQIAGEITAHPIGTVDITENGIHDVAEYESALVNVPIPEGYLKPEGTVAIAANGIVDVAEYAEAEVNVPQTQIVPLEVTANGIYTAPEGVAYSPVAVDVGGDTPDPADGKTHVWITIGEDTPVNRLTFTLRWTQSATNGVQVDWGDGSEPETYTGTGEANHDHTYPQGGNYEIVLEVLSGTMAFGGTATSYRYAIYGDGDDPNSYNRGRIRRMVIGDAVTSIGNYAFYNCYGLTTITLLGNLTSIGNYAFYNCYSLTTITLPDSLTSIGSYAFYSCHSLTAITIPDNVTQIKNYTFYCCYGLTTITLPDNLTSIASYAFSDCYGLTAITIPDNVKTIASNTFRNCHRLTSLILSNSLTSIGESAFYWDYNVLEIKLPEKLTDIGRYALQAMSGLTSLVIPSKVTHIGSMAINLCWGLGRLRFEPTTPPKMDYKLSGLSTDCIISVPVGSLSAYKSAANYPSSSTYTYIEE